MKRLYISLVIIILIIAIGIMSIYLIAAQNQKLYGEIDNVISKYAEGADITHDIEALESTFRSYNRLVGSISSDERIQQIEESISRLKAMYIAQSDEFLAECYLVKTIAKEILDEQKPTVQRLL